MSATLFVAIGAVPTRVLTGIGAGVGISKATSSAVDAIARQPEAESKISKSLLLGLFPCRSNGYCSFRYCPVDHSFPEIIIAIFNRTYGTVRMRGRCSYVKFGTLDNLLDRRQCPCPFVALQHFLIKPVMGVIKQRNEMIKQQFNAAQKTQDEANKMKADYEQQLDTAKEQAADIIAAARVRSKKNTARRLLIQRLKESKCWLRPVKILKKNRQMPRKNCSHRSWILPCWLQRKLL